MSLVLAIDSSAVTASAALTDGEKVIKSEFANADVVIGVTRGLCSFYAEQGGMLVGMES